MVKVELAKIIRVPRKIEIENFVSLNYLGAPTLIGRVEILTFFSYWEYR